MLITILYEYTQFLCSRTILPELLKVRPVPKSKLLEGVVAELLQAGRRTPFLLPKQQRLNTEG